MHAGGLLLKSKPYMPIPCERDTCRSSIWPSQLVDETAWIGKLQIAYSLIMAPVSDSFLSRLFHFWWIHWRHSQASFRKLDQHLVPPAPRRPPWGFPLVIENINTAEFGSIDSQIPTDVI